MPLLIFHNRTRLSLAFVQQRAILGGAPTLTVPGRANEFHIDSPPNSVFKIIHLFKFKVKQIMLIKANYNQQMCSTSCSTDYSAIKLFVLGSSIMKKLLGIFVLGLC